MTAEPILSTRPVYLQIKDILALRITDGRWRATEVIPGEHELALQFKVSVATVRKALTALENNGLIERKQGRGTFVTNRLSEAYKSKYDRIRQNDGSRLDWIYLWQSVSSCSANSEQAKALEIEEGADLFRVDRLRRGGAKVFMSEKSFHPAEVFAGLNNETDIFRGIVSLCHAYNVVIGTFSQTLRNVIAGEEFAAQTGCDPSASIWELKRISRDYDGRAIEYRIALVLPDNCIYSDSTH